METSCYKLGNIIASNPRNFLESLRDSGKMMRNIHTRTPFLEHLKRFSTFFKPRNTSLRHKGTFCKSEEFLGTFNLWNYSVELFARTDVTLAVSHRWPGDLTMVGGGRDLGEGLEKSRTVLENLFAAPVENHYFCRKRCVNL